MLALRSLDEMTMGQVGQSNRRTKRGLMAEYESTMKYNLAGGPNPDFGESDGNLVQTGRLGPKIPRNLRHVCWSQDCSFLHRC